MRFGRKTKRPRVRVNRRLSPGCSLLVLGVFALIIYFFIAPWNVIKAVGEPFSFLPDALGWTTRVTKDETHRFVLPGERAVVENLDAGRYIVFMSGWFSWGTDATLVVFAEDVAGATLPYRHVRYYDPVFIDGIPAMFFETFDSGMVEIIVKPAPGTDLPDAFDLVIIPDYTSGNESTIHAVTVLQLAVLLIVSVLIYIIFLRDKREQRYTEHKNSQEQKRENMDDFLKDL